MLGGQRQLGGGGRGFRKLHTQELSGRMKERAAVARVAQVRRSSGAIRMSLQ